MLKNLYNSSMKSINPDSSLIESTKSAMYNQLKMSASTDDKSAYISVLPTSNTTPSAWLKAKKYASLCAVFALVIGIAAICAIISGNKNSNEFSNSDPFASSEYSGFDGNNANNGANSVSVSIMTTTSQTSAATTSQKNTAETTAASEIATAAVSESTTKTTTTARTTLATTLQTSFTTSTAKTTTTTTAASGTANNNAQTQSESVQPAPENPENSDNPKEFGYYDPQYDPNFNMDFGQNKGEEFLFEHENIYYYFDFYKSDKVMLDINGKQYSLRQALDQKLITPQELLGFEGFICKGYYNDDRLSAPLDVHGNHEGKMEQSGGFMDSQEEPKNHEPQ